MSLHMDGRRKDICLWSVFACAESTLWLCFRSASLVRCVALPLFLTAFMTAQYYMHCIRSVCDFCTSASLTQALPMYGVHCMSLWLLDHVSNLRHNGPFNKFPYRYDALSAFHWNSMYADIWHSHSRAKSLAMTSASTSVCEDGWG